MRFALNRSYSSAANTGHWTGREPPECCYLSIPRPRSFFFGRTDRSYTAAARSRTARSWASSSVLSTALGTHELLPMQANRAECC